jgi:flap endonuclease-1
MGVSDFSKVFEAASKPVKDPLAGLKGRRVAIDMNLVLCKAVAAVHSAHRMTDPAGTPTAGLVNLISLLPRLIRAGATRIIAVFDNPEPNPMKKAECAKRRARHEAAEIKAACAGEQAPWCMSEAIIEDAKRMLLLFGVEYHVAAIGREAEQHAADLVKAGIVDAVITDDTDALMFGAAEVIMMRKTQADGHKYDGIVYSLPELLASFGLTMTEFVHVCVALGTDFAPKMRGVGPATALTSGKNKPLDEEQTHAMDYIMSAPSAPPVIAGPVPADLPALAKWLVDTKGFTRIRVVKALGLGS